MPAYLGQGPVYAREAAERILMKHFIANTTTNWVLVHPDPLKAQQHHEFPNPILTKAIAEFETIIGWEIDEGGEQYPITSEGEALLDLGSAIFDRNTNAYLPIHDSTRWLSEVEFVDHLFGYDYSANRGMKND